MIQFFIVFLQDITNNETILFSKYDGSATPIVILDDGWAPNITKYVRNGEKTWDDVVEELECMTNVATRDEALELIEKINSLIHRAARDIEEKQQYTVRFVVRSQFSNAPNSAFTYVVSPPDDGNVIALSTDIQTAPPGQIRFKLRFKRTGAWITTFNDIEHQSILTSDINPPSGYWKLQTTLPTNITIPTPVSLTFSFTAGGTNDVDVKQLFMCANVENVYPVKDFIAPPFFDMDIVSYPYWRLAYLNYGYVILDNTDSYATESRPQAAINLNSGTYAVFVAWRSVQPNVSHRLQIQFDNNTETRNIMLLSSDTEPRYTYFGTITMTEPASFLYLRTTIGNTTGFEIEKILIIRLKATSEIFSISNWVFVRNASVTVNNSVIKPIKNIIHSFTSGTSQLRQVLSTYDSVDIIADRQSFTVVAIGNSSNVFSLRTKADYYPVNTLPVTITYRPIRTTFH